MLSTPRGLSYFVRLRVHFHALIRITGVCAYVGILFLALDGKFATAAPIFDASFFDTLPTTIIDFETDGNGQPLIIPSGSGLPMPANEYASQGITFSPAIGWSNDGSTFFDDAQAIGGSPDNAIPEPPDDDFTLQFTTPVLAFGFWVVNNNDVAQAPTFTARDTGGSDLETVVFSGAAIDGTIGIADYGFMGISSSTPIASVRITKDATNFDNLHFSFVPEPATWLFAIAGIAVGLSSRFQK